MSSIDHQLDLLAQKALSRTASRFDDQRVSAPNILSNSPTSISPSTSPKKKQSILQRSSNVGRSTSTTFVKDSAMAREGLVSRGKTSRALPKPVDLPRHPTSKVSATEYVVNIFVFTSKGSELVVCPEQENIQWLLETCTDKFSSKGLNASLAFALVRDGATLGHMEIIGDVIKEHPVTFFTFLFAFNF